METVSSKELAVRLGLKSPQIRKDLSYFGALGTRGVGYPVEATQQRIREILKLNTTQKAALVGAGRLGTALVAYPGFSSFGLEIAAVFDNAPKKIGKKVGPVKIEAAGRISSHSAGHFGGSGRGGPGNRGSSGKSRSKRDPEPVALPYQNGPAGQDYRY